MTFTAWAITGGHTTPDPRFNGVISFGFAPRISSSHFLRIKEYPCTGFTVGAHLIMTVAHCVLDSEKLANKNGVLTGSEDSIQIAGRGAMKNFSNLVIKAIHIHKNVAVMSIIENGKVVGDAVYRNDMALIEVKETLPGPIYKVIENIPVDLAQRNLIQAGYGCDRLSPRDSRLALKIAERTGGILKDRILDMITLPKSSTAICKGDSGGPTFIEDGGELVVVGVNTSKALVEQKVVEVSKNNGLAIETIKLVSEIFSTDYITRVDFDWDNQNQFWLRKFLNR